MLQILLLSLTAALASSSVCGCSGDASLKPGFSIDIMAGLTVLLGSNFGIPLSTTHCKVGAVVAVSLIHNRNAVSWRTFGNIAWAWIVTLPVSGAISAFFYWLIIE